MTRIPTLPRRAPGEGGAPEGGVGAGPDGRPRWRGFAWHPLLFAAWPVVFLYAGNVGETPLPDFLRALGIVLGLTAALYATLTLIVRDTHRAALLVSVTVLAVLLFGHVHDLAGNPRWLLPLWLVGGVAVGVLALRIRALREVTTVLTGVAVVLVALASIPALQAKIPALLRERRAPAAAAADLGGSVGAWSAGGEPRDIYYLIFDRYGSSSSLRKAFRYDNRGFLDELRRRGFTVTPDSKANHLKTPSSLASSLNLRYLTDLEQRYGPDTGNMLPVHELLAHHTLGRLLQERGYTYVHVGAWFGPTQTNPEADLNLGYDTRSDFLAELLDTTLLRVLPERLRGPSRETVHFQGALAQFRALTAVAENPEPTFTFAHVLLPHGPFVFHHDGRRATRSQVRAWKKGRAYREQVRFTNSQILEALDELLAVPEDQRPIVVVQADEGPDSKRYGRMRARGREDAFNWATATRSELRLKFGILNAYYLPGAEAAGLYPSISP
ncbi:MAG: sulfatase-like hydrolase/transferase, partial [Euzebyales bacterium]|nr:sulfatase-like hydrolase/transferase [Euzebyales bacterium]